MYEGRKGEEQKEYTRHVREHVRAAHAAVAPGPLVAALYAGGGPSRGAWLETVEGVEPLADQAFLTGLRQRLMLPVVVAGTPCKHRGQEGAGGLASGTPCGHPLDEAGHHAVACSRGGGTIRRHDALRDVLVEWLREHGTHAVPEQVVPQWSRPRPRAAPGDLPEAARLDVSYHHRELGQVFLDVSVVDSVAAAQQGAAHTTVLEVRERRKHNRYPGPNLYPIVMDVRGRWGAEAEAWLKRQLRSLPERARAAARQLLRTRLALALRSQVAEQIALAAE